MRAWSSSQPMSLDPAIADGLTRLSTLLNEAEALAGGRGSNSQLSVAIETLGQLMRYVGLTEDRESEQIQLEEIKLLNDQLLKDIQTHPERHRHNFQGLMRCSSIRGVISLSILDAHSRYAPVGMNGGRKCDSVGGPCACGAWH